MDPSKVLADPHAGNKAQGPTIWDLATGEVLRQPEAVIAAAPEEMQTEPEAVADALPETAVLTALEGMLNLDVPSLVPEVAITQGEAAIASPEVVVFEEPAQVRTPL